MFCSTVNIIISVSWTQKDPQQKRPYASRMWVCVVTVAVVLTTAPQCLGFGTNGNWSLSYVHLRGGDKNTSQGLLPWVTL